MKSTIIHLTYHFLLGLGVGVFCWWLTENFWLGILGAGVNIFIDLDHLIEYLAFSKRFKLKEFLNGSYFAEKGKIVVIFHNWEAVILGFILWILAKSEIFLAIALGIGIHLVFDQLSWGLYPWAYFLTYRIKNKFAIAKISKDKKCLSN